MTTNERIWMTPNPDYHINKRWGVGSEKNKQHDGVEPFQVRRPAQSRKRRQQKRDAKRAGVPLKQWLARGAS